MALISQNTKVVFDQFVVNGPHMMQAISNDGGFEALSEQFHHYASSRPGANLGTSTSQVPTPGG